ncbi:MAG: DNA-directed RNA polymerase beta subunit [Pseudohongiellaceae bacterium]
MAQDSKSDSAISDNQRAFAESLGVVVSDFPDIEALVEKIETSLGQNTMLEQSRWFVMSVLCHSNRGAWLTIDESEIDKEKQYEIAGSYIGTDGFKQSLRTVLKEGRCKFTLLKFAKSRNIEKRTLSTTTKAFKHAQSLLKELGLINAAKATARKVTKDTKDTKVTKVKKVTKVEKVKEVKEVKEVEEVEEAQRAKEVQEAIKARQSTSPKKRSEADKDSLGERRSAPRGDFEDDFLNLLNPQQESEELLNSQIKMGDQEFAELDAKIDMAVGSVFENWSGEESENRTILLVGLAAVGVMFAVVIWLFI